MYLPEGAALSPGTIRAAVARLDGAGWFAAIRVEEDGQGLTFAVEEYPYVSVVDYSRSRLLSRETIETALRENDALPAIARPLHPLRLQRASRILARALGELGHPFARVEMRQHSTRAGAVQVTCEITEGPYVPVHAVSFAGASAFSPRQLRKQLRAINPDAWFAGLRRKNLYTPGAAAADAQGIAAYYQAHGFPFVKIGEPRLTATDIVSRKWWPWPRTAHKTKLHLRLPIEEGPRIQWESFAVYDCFGNSRDEVVLRHPAWKRGTPYSAETVHQIAADLVKVLPCAGSIPEVRAHPQIDRSGGSAHVSFRSRRAEILEIRRIAFSGHHRFPERFYRHRLKMAEGQPWAPEKLNAGLAAIARDGFVKPLDDKNVQLNFDRVAGAVDVHIRVEEAGRQRFSLVGGFSTLGLAYNLFNSLGGEEVLTGYLEGGPPSLRLALGLAKDGLLGNRAGLGFSLYHNVVRPRLPGRRKERLFEATSTGIGQSIDYSPTRIQTVNLAYHYESTKLEIPADASSSGLIVRTRFSSGRMSAAWQRTRLTSQMSAEAAISGGPLGGSEELLRFSGFAIRYGTPGGRSEWGVRIQSAGAFVAPWGPSSQVPPHALLYPGEEWVRGVRSGEFSALCPGCPRGLNLVQGANLEQGFSLEPRGRLRLAAFADGAIGWLLEGVAGSSRVRSTRASFGLELRWRMPAGMPRYLPLGGETIRWSYALAPWLRSGGRRGAWGWALGALF